MTIDRLLAQRAEEVGETCFVRFRDRELSFAEVDLAATEVAHGLAGLGVTAGRPVALLLGNRVEFVVTWFALTKLGAVAAPVNTAFRGRGLAHALNITEADVVVVEPELADALEPVAKDLVHLRLVVVTEDSDLVAARLPSLLVLPFSALESGNSASIVSHSRDRDLAMLLFTSGTTGRAKACQLSHRYAIRHAELFVEQLRIGRDDVLYCPFPLFHLDAIGFTVMPALLLGTTAALAERFSVSRFWEEIRSFRATIFDFMGATLTMLYKKPPLRDDADNPAHMGWGGPLPNFADDFERRFDLELVEVYGLTDAGIVMYPPADRPRVRGSCGRPGRAYEVSLVDEEGNHLAAGEVGEIAVRPRAPGLLADGYFHMPEETMACRRDLWFHTGDLARRDADDNYFFVGRRTEVIRRRGENISAFEVEEAISAHPAVLEVAAFGVPSELTEEELMVAVVLRPGASLQAAELIEFCKERTAGYMLPRFIDFAPSLPRTATEKVEKYRLVERGVGEGTWDRDAWSPSSTT